MADDEQKRIKMCRYCDGLIEWGTEVCPHCGKELEIVKFDDLDFVKADDPPAGAAAPASPPVIEPIQPDAAPVVTPIGPPRANPPPPVVKPIAGKPSKPPIAKPTSRIRRRRKPPPVAKPISRPPPVAQPISEPPLVQPLPEESDLPPGVSSVAECPICGSDVTNTAERGGTCGHCEGIVCLPCLMRANGVKAGSDTAANRAEWERYLGGGSKTIRCPACGQPGIH